MQNLIMFCLAVCPIAFYFGVGLWVLENTKLGDKAVHLLEKVFM